MGVGSLCLIFLGVIKLLTGFERLFLLLRSSHIESVLSFWMEPSFSDAYCCRS